MFEENVQNPAIRQVTTFLHTQSINYSEMLQQTTSKDATVWKKYTCDVCGKNKIINGEYEYKVHLKSTQRIMHWRVICYDYLIALHTIYKILISWLLKDKMKARKLKKAQEKDALRALSSSSSHSTDINTEGDKGKVEEEDEDLMLGF